MTTFMTQAACFSMGLILTLLGKDGGAWLAASVVIGTLPGGSA